MFAKVNNPTKSREGEILVAKLQNYRSEDRGSLLISLVFDQVHLVALPAHERCFSIILLAK